MKILELDLHSFGPFTNLQLDLSAGEEGLHVIYGPNEAGKSSALRALFALLYGVPERTTDDFVHDKQSMRVGGRIQGRGGIEQVLYRRKGRKNTLLGSADGDVVDDLVMTQLLEGVDERLFQSLFGIDHASLLEGGESLLLEQGQEAEALFGSGLGSTAVHTLLESFETRTRDLFAPQASKPRINSLLKELKDTKGNLREVSLSSKKWSEAQTNVNDANDQLNQLEEQIDEVSTRRSMLERVRRTLPNLAKRDSSIDRLNKLKDVPKLPSDFHDQCQEALNNLSQARKDKKQAEEKKRSTDNQLEGIDFSENLIERAYEIEELRERLGNYRRSVTSLPKLEGRREESEKTATDQLQRIRTDLSIKDISPLRLALSMSRRLTDLGSQKEVLEGKLATAQSAKNKAAKERKGKLEKIAKFGDLPDVASAQEVAGRGRALGEIDSEVADEHSRLELEKKSIEAHLMSLGLWKGGIDDFLVTSLPSEETVQVFVEGLEALVRQQDDAEKDHKQAKTGLSQAEEVLKKLELVGDVPTEEELGELRSSRDSAWQLLRRKWLKNEDISADADTFGGIEGLPDEFEQRIGLADEISDRLRRESKSVHEHSEAKAKKESGKQIIAQIEATQTELQESKQKLSDEWVELWSEAQIPPRSPREMRKWRIDATRIRERIESLNEKQGQLNSRLSRRQEVLDELIEALGSIGCEIESPKDRRLNPILSKAASHIQSIETSIIDRQKLIDRSDELEKEILACETDEEAAQEQSDSWARRWNTRILELGLTEGKSATDMLDYIESCQEVANLVDELLKRQQEIGELKSDIKKFDEDVNAIIGKVAADLSGKPAVEAVNSLTRRLTEHRKAATRRETYKDLLSGLAEELSSIETAILGCIEDLELLCNKSGCKNPDDLLEIGKKASDRDELEQGLKEIEDELLRGGDGLSIDELVKEASKVDRDQVNSQIEQIDAQLKHDLNPERRRRIEAKSDLEHILGDMSGSDEAAGLADEIQSIVSEITELSREYIRNKLAGRILKDQIERFRRQNRSPILTKAAHYFGRVTCGAFSGISTSFDESDNPVLVAIRSTTERLRVEEMSTGTRDQLYLALRMAALEHYADGAEPMPFIVDDILIQFDDERSVATLKALAEFSARTQVILFTHHQKVADQAKGLSKKGEQVFIHELERFPVDLGVAQ